MRYPPPEDHWLDDVGPVVRPFAVSGGRTRPAGKAFDLLSMVWAEPVRVNLSGLGPEHLSILGICRRATAVADLASEVDLPLGVLRVLLGDLRERGLISVRPPAPPAVAPDRRVLEEVLHGLRAL